MKRLLSSSAAGKVFLKAGLDITIIQRRPQTNGALMLLFGKIEFRWGAAVRMSGGSITGNAQTSLLLIAVCALASKNLIKISKTSHHRIGNRPMGGSAAAETRLCRRGRNQHVL